MFGGKETSVPGIVAESGFPEGAKVGILDSFIVPSANGTKHSRANMPVYLTNAFHIGLKLSVTLLFDSV